MVFTGVGNLISQDSYTSKETGNTYYSAIFIDNTGSQIKVNMDYPLDVLEFPQFSKCKLTVDVKVMPKFTSINLKDISIID